MQDSNFSCAWNCENIGIVPNEITYDYNLDLVEFFVRSMNDFVGRLALSTAV